MFQFMPKLYLGILASVAFAITSCRPESATLYTDPVFPIRENNLWGAIDSSGKVLVKPMYSDASLAEADNGFSLARLVGQQGLMLTSAEKWCFVGSKSQRIIDPFTDDLFSVHNYGESLFAIIEKGTPIDHQGSIPSFVYDPSGRWKPEPGVLPRTYMKEGLIVISKDGKSGFANRDGATVIAPVYDYCLPFHNGLAAVILDQKCGYINTLGEVVVKPQYAFPVLFDQGVALVKKADQEESVFIDITGEELHEWIPPDNSSFSHSYHFSHGLAPASIDEGANSRVYGYTDRHGQWRIKPQFKQAYTFYDGLARVELHDESYGLSYRFIDIFGKTRINCWGLGLNFRFGLAWDGSVDQCSGRCPGRYVNLAGETIWSAK